MERHLLNDHAGRIWAGTTFVKHAVPLLYSSEFPAFASMRQASDNSAARSTRFAGVSLSNFRPDLRAALQKTWVRTVMVHAMNSEFRLRVVAAEYVYLKVFWPPRWRSSLQQYNWTEQAPLPSLTNLLPAFLPFRDSIRDGLLVRYAFFGAVDKFFRRRRVARLYERFHFVLGSDVVSGPHFFHLEALGDDAYRVGFLAECEQCIDHDFCIIFRVHRIRISK